MDSAVADPAVPLTELRWPGPAPARLRGAAIAVGNFDGAHLGHRAVIEECRRHAATSGVVTFEPHPRQVFAPDAPPFRLTAWPAKARRLASFGADFALVIGFDRAFASRSAESFVDEVLVAHLGPAHVVVGANFAFGNGRRGTPDMLRARLAAQGIGMTCMAPATGPDGQAYSSTRVRAALVAGDPAGAAALLGAPWEVEGRVGEGDRRGRVLGFPTANVPLGDHLRPRFGVYAVEAGIVGAPGAAPRWVKGVANIGSRPTVGGTEPRVEAHLFDFAEDIYGKTLRVRLIDFLRAERKFDGLDALKAQIAADSAEARRRLARR
ncbi:MAG: bifunctional riboflavin kinase/FAD synthetase [Alphaproteobacteria bacterium]|nr:bifunctional riboflavin kinase/FAD synthetase [Alphaproteobacteria bacterium]